MTFAGLRGAVSLCVALFVDHMAIHQGARDVRHRRQFLASSSM